MQVVKVSGTIRKAEEEAIRRAKASILKARQEDHDGSSDALDAILGPAKERESTEQHEDMGEPVMGIESEDMDDDDDEDPTDEDD
ncbi:MAG: hypothetical protein Q9222_006976 [Ikaeria aurantiellina]